MEIKKSTKTALFQSLLTLSILHGLALEVTTKREAMFSRRRCKQNAILLLACVALFVLFKWLFVSKIFGKNEKCLVYSPAYPSAGGPGCSPRCVEKEGKKTAMYGAVFHGDSHQTWPKDLVENMKLAGTILKKHGRPKTLNTEGRLVLHLAFDYYCCYTEEEGIKIGNFLNKHLFLITSLGGRYKTQVTGHRAQGTGYRAQGTGYRAQGTGYRAQKTQ